MKQLTDFILEIPNVIHTDLSYRLIGSIQPHMWAKSIVYKGGVDQDIRNCSSVPLYNTPFDSLMFEVASHSLSEYRKVFPELLVQKDTGYEVLKYEVGGKYAQHVDSYDINPRMLTMSVTLNEDFEGGDWLFFDGEYRLKPKAGSAVMFPSNFMYPHAISPITSGVRYSLITWFI